MVRDTSSTSVCYWRWVRCSASPGPQYLPSVQKGWLYSVQVPGGVHIRLWWTWAVCRPWSTKLVQSYSPTNKDPLWSHGEWVMLSMKWRSWTGEEPQRGYQLNLLKSVERWWCQIPPFPPLPPSYIGPESRFSMVCDMPLFLVVSVRIFNIFGMKGGRFITTSGRCLKAVSTVLGSLL